jgi:hypothetical protein
MGLLEVGKSRDWIDLAQGREKRRVLVNAVMKFGVPIG